MHNAFSNPEHAFVQACDGVFFDLDMHGYGVDIINEIGVLAEKCGEILLFN